MRPIRLLCLVLLVLCGAGPADTVRELIRRGNEHYAAGRYAEALESYEQASADAGWAAELLHNRAAANFKLGQLDAARDLWVRLKSMADPVLEARTRYNLGNCDYAEALASGQQNPQQAVELLDQAAEQYREALRLDPSLSDARANLELSQLLKRQIEEQLQNQPQTQPTTDQSQQQQQQQKKKQDSSSSQPSQTPQTRPSEPEQPQEGKEQSEDRDAQDQSGQEGKEGDQEQSDQRSGTEPETPPAESESAEDQHRQQERAPVEMTRAQAQRLLQMVRDAEKQRREMLARRQMARQRPVERDW